MKEFTNLYQLSKTLKFNIDPIRETKEKLDEFSKYFADRDSANEKKYENNIFKKDEDIAKAKEILQEVLNSIHEQIITKSLTSKEARNIDIMPYYEAMLNSQKAEKIDDDKKMFLEKELRGFLKQCFIKPLESFNKQVAFVKKRAGKISNDSNKKKQSRDEFATLLKGLGEDDVLKYISQNASKFASKTIKEKSIEDACNTFSGYWGLMSQYIENRKNYYVFDEEQDTAVATRIVSDNLPRFCMNAIQYNKAKDTYDAIFTILKSLNIECVIKNSVSGKNEPIESFTSS